jgi:hypothetical protein
MAMQATLFRPPILISRASSGLMQILSMFSLIVFPTRPFSRSIPRTASGNGSMFELKQAPYQLGCRALFRSDASQGAPTYSVMKKRGKGKIHNSVFDAMEEKWPDHRVPKSLSVKAIAREIENSLLQRGIKKPHDDIRRILGLKS